MGVWYTPSGASPVQLQLQRVLPAARKQMRQ